MIVSTLVDFVLNSIPFSNFNHFAKIDNQVQTVLNEYWPGTTGLTSLKRASDKQVYKAIYGEKKVVVKSVDFTPAVEQYTLQTMNFVNYLSDSLSVAEYIVPGVKRSDDMTKIITVSRFAPGVAPEKLADVAPWTWIGVEAAVKSNGAWWGEFRHKSMLYTVEHPEQYEAYPRWDQIADGWQKQFTPLDIPMTPENFGIIHGDAHTGNWLIEKLGKDQYNFTVIDWDFSQRNFYLVDIATIIWKANCQLYYGGQNYTPVPEYEHHFDNFKKWFLEGYGWSVDPVQLTAACKRRVQFEYYYQLQVMLANTVSGSDAHNFAVAYISAYEAGTIPYC